MEKYENLQEVIAENLVYYRKKANLTQSQLAEKLNYSDKSISKWERKEGVPDILILSNLAKIYGLTVNDFLTRKKKEKIAMLNVYVSRIFIVLLSMALVAFLATLAFSLLLIFKVPKPYLAFIYAVPIGCIVMMIYNRLFFKRVLNVFPASVGLWGITAGLFLNFIHVDYSFMIFIIAIPFQVFLIFLYIFILKRGKQK